MDSDQHLDGSRKLSERVSMLLKKADDPMSMSQIRQALQLVGTHDGDRLSMLLCKMARLGLLAAEKRKPRSVFYTFLRDRKHAYNQSGLDRLERRRLNSERARRKAGAVPMAEYRAGAEGRRLARESRKLKARALKREEKSKAIAILARAAERASARHPETVATPQVKGETVDQWMKRTGGSPEVLPGLRKAPPAGRRPGLAGFASTSLGYY